MDTQTLQLLQQTAQHLHEHNQQAYLVGGSIRNVLLNQPCADWDIVATGDAPRLARSLADKLGGYYAHMHDKASRITIKHEQQETILDLSPLQGKTIQADLHQRDFTINAIAAPLSEIVRLFESGNVPTIQSLGAASTVAGILSGGQITRGEVGVKPNAGINFIDPLNGLADILARQLKAVNDNIFQHDPLRMLRAIRLKARYQLSIHFETAQLIKRDASLLLQSAPERIHEELYTILEPNGATAQLHLLDTLGLLTILIPEFIPARGMRQPKPHYWDVLEHSLETVGMLEQLVGMLQQEGEGDLTEIRALVQEAEQQGIFQLVDFTAPRMKLAALLHDIGKPITYSTDENGNIRFYDHPQAGIPLVQHIMSRLSASTQDRRLIQLVTAHHMRPGQLAHTDPVTPRAIRRYFVDLGATGIHITLFSLADHLATLGPQPRGNSWERHLAVVRLLLTRYIRERHSILPPRLISAEELIRRLKLEPGPLIGQLLEHLAEAQTEGLIHSKEEALWLAEEKLLQTPPPNFSP